MLIQPFTEILNREPENEEVASILNYCADAVEDLVNMGTYVFYWELERKKESIESLPLLLLYRNFLEMIDAISVLIRQCCVDACQINLRVALDAMFQLEYLVKSDTERRAYAYIVYDKLKKIDKLKKSVPDSQEHKEFMSHFKDRSFMDVSGGNFYTSPLAEKELEALYASLDNPDLEEYKIEYKKVKNLYWYSFLEVLITLRNYQVF